MAQNWLKRLQASNAQHAIDANTQHTEIDADDDGRLSAKELAQACKITMLEAEELIEQYDEDGDGQLDVEEFEILKQQILDQQRQKITNTISYNDQSNQFDANDDDRVDANELSQACNISVIEAQNIIAQYDVDGDDMLDRQEFEQLKQQITDEQRQNMTNIMSYDDQYNKFDADNDGRIEASELAETCNISLMEAQNIIAQYDVDGDGKLDTQEFEQLKQQIIYQQRQNMTNAISVNDEYNQFDADNDGRIEASELAAACNISLVEATNIIAQYDFNGDGTLDTQEFECLKQQILDQQRENMTNTMSHNDAFTKFDANDDGRIDASELSRACNISLVEAQNIIAQYDVDGDAKLDAQEFERLKQQIMEQQRQNMTDKITANDEYNQFDANNDGRVDASELAEATNIRLVEAQNIIAQYDVDGDGKLDPQEFEQLKQQMLDQQRQKMTHKIAYDDKYDQFDADDDGRVDANELVQACNISLIQAQAIIAQYDVDGDGKLDRQEFKRLKDQMMQQQRSNGANNLNAEQQKHYNNQQRTGFQEHNQNNKAAKCGGDIDRVNRKEYNLQNSNAAQAFGVDVFANKPRYNQPKTTPFGRPQARKNNGNLFGKPPPRKNSDHLFGRPSAKPVAFGSTPNRSPFGTGSAPKQVPESAVKVDRGAKYKHKWELFISYDPQKEEITLKVEDTVTRGVWYKTVSKQEHLDIKQEYFRIGKLINSGDAKYTLEPNEAVVKVSLKKGMQRYDFNAQSV